jgi:hypothetical protein
LSAPQPHCVIFLKPQMFDWMRQKKVSYLLSCINSKKTKPWKLIILIF